MVVIGVIGVLTGVLLMILNPKAFRGKARDGVRYQDLAVVKGALEQYYAEKNVYPLNAEVVFGSGWTNYLKKVPQDPLNSTASWGYCYDRPTAQNYVMCAWVEDAGNANSLSTTCIPSPTSAPADSNGKYCVENTF